MRSNVSDELLLVNDEMNSTFDKYDRYMINRTQQQTGSAATGGGGADPQLIDFSDPSHSVPTSQLASLS